MVSFNGELFLQSLLLGEMSGKLLFMINLGKLAYGMWSGGRFMHFGEMLDEDKLELSVQQAFSLGIDTFVTSDVYGLGKANQLLGRALEGVSRADYKIVSMIGHDMFIGQRQGSQGYPRFTDPLLRKPAEYDDFLKMACEKSLHDCQTDYFDLLMIHNPDEQGYTLPEVWTAMSELKYQGLIKGIGIAPGPANGFVLDLLDVFENFGDILDWAMLILNPLEPWPANLVLPLATKQNIQVMTRVVDYGGLFWGEISSGIEFKAGDHRSYRRVGWVEEGCRKLELLKPIASKYGVSLMDLACQWNLQQESVSSVVPTLIQESFKGAMPYEEKVKRLANFTSFELEVSDQILIGEIGDNTGCMPLKGGSHRHSEHLRVDEWPMTEHLANLAKRYDLTGWNH